MNNRTGIVHGMCVVNAGAKSYLSTTPENCLQETAKEKENVPGGLPPETSPFSPFFASVDRILEVEAGVTLKRIARHLATNWHQPYLRTCGYVNSSIAITLLRDTHWCIWGSRVPAHRIIVQRPQWEEGVGLNLFQ